MAIATDPFYVFQKSDKGERKRRRERLARDDCVFGNINNTVCTIRSEHIYCTRYFSA